MKLPHPAIAEESECVRTRERLVERLRERHPDRHDRELVHALSQAKGLMEMTGHARLVATASLLLE